MRSIQTDIIYKMECIRIYFTFRRRIICCFNECTQHIIKGEGIIVCFHRFYNHKKISNRNESYMGKLFKVIRQCKVRGKNLLKTKKNNVLIILLIQFLFYFLSRNYFTNIFFSAVIL